MDPTLPTGGSPGETERIATPTELKSATASSPAGERAQLSSRIELVAALITGVVGLEVLALIVGLLGGPKSQSVSTRVEIVSLNIDAKLALILLVAAMLATLRNIVTADFDTPRSDLGRRTLIAVAVLGALIAILSLVGIGIDIARSDFLPFGNKGAAVIHRLAVVLMAGTATGWSLSALGIRITTNRA